MLTGDPHKVQRDITKKTLYIATVPALFSLLWGEFSSILGLVFGLAVSLLLFRLKVVNIDKALDMPAEKARKFIVSRYFVNYIIYFVVLIVAQQKANINFLAVVMGLLLLKFTIIGTAIVAKLRNSWTLKIDEFS